MGSIIGWAESTNLRRLSAKDNERQGNDKLAEAACREIRLNSAILRLSLTISLATFETLSQGPFQPPLYVGTAPLGKFDPAWRR